MTKAEPPARGFQVEVFWSGSRGTAPGGVSGVSPEFLPLFRSRRERPEKPVPERIAALPIAT